MMGSSTSMTTTSCPSSRGRSPAVVTAATGAASASMNSDPRRGLRRVDRQIRRPRLQHRQDRDDRLGRTGKQQRHMLIPGPHRDGQQVRQPVGGLVNLAVRLTTSRIHQRHRLGVRATCAAHNAGIDTGRRLGRCAESTPPGCPTHPARARSPSSSRSIDDNRPWDRPSSPPTPAPTARSAPRCWPRRTHRCETPPPRRSRRAHRPAVKRSARENVRSMRAAWVSTGIGVTCSHPTPSPAAESCLPGEVLPGQHHLDQRVMGQRSGGLSRSTSTSKGTS